MKSPLCTRRDLIRLSLMASLLGISGCLYPKNKILITSGEGVLLKEWLKIIPSNWELKSLKYSSDVILFSQSVLKESNFLVINDGWIDSLPRNMLITFNENIPLSRLNYQAISFLDGLGSDFENKVFPIGVSPWVMLFRNGDNWFNNEEISWDILLEPTLKNLIALPQNSRLIISIANNMTDQNALNKLINNTNIYDDVNALDWLLLGEARVAILPLSRCWMSLIRDPRLRAIIPHNGSPLSWTVMLKSSTSADQDLSIDWIERSWNEKYQPFLLSKGWMSPLPISELRKYSKSMEERYRSLILPSELFWQKCWSLPLLDKLERKELQRLWTKSS